MDHRPATASTTFFLNVIELLAILAVIAAVWLVYARRDGWAFTVTAVTIASCILAIFVAHAATPPPTGYGQDKARPDRRDNRRRRNQAHPARSATRAFSPGRSLSLTVTDSPGQPGMPWDASWDECRPHPCAICAFRAPMCGIHAVRTPGVRAAHF